MEGVRALDLHAVGRLRKDSVLRFPYTGPHARRPGRRRQFDGGFDRRDPARMSRTTLDDEAVDLYHAVLHGKAWQCWMQVVYVLPRGADPRTKEGVLLYSTDLKLAPARLFRIYRARFQIEFAFRDAKQHLGLNHCQARSQAKLHFHFNIVFAALFWARLQARLRAHAAPGPLFPARSQASPLRGGNPQMALPSARPRAETPPMPRPLAAPSRRHARGCAHPLSKRGCPAPEHHFPTGPTIRSKPQNVSKP